MVQIEQITSLPINGQQDQCLLRSLTKYYLRKRQQDAEKA